jgi:glutamine amidotransferase
VSAAGVAPGRSVPHGKPRIAVVDHGAGNLVSVMRALEHVGAKVRLARRPKDLAGAAAVVLPGVGASAPAMARLRRSGMDVGIRAAVEDGATYLGICLGMQLLFEHSDEDGAEMLGLLRGPVRRLRDAPRLPHTGWNTIEPVRPHPLLDGLRPGAAAYFVHSYAPEPDRESDVVATSVHGRPFPCVVAEGRLLGVQFHPERSGDDGLRVLANFAAIAAQAA